MVRESFVSKTAKRRFSGPWANAGDVEKSLVILRVILRSFPPTSIDFDDHVMPGSMLTGQ